MKPEEREITWIQCQNCGHIYYIKRKISIERSIVAEECPRCEDFIGLNCGNSKDDIYLYMNPNLDRRFYQYK